MSHLAAVHLRQARSFLRVGDSGRAAELLEKARALAADDPSMLRDVISDLVDAYAQLGRHDKAELMRERLQFLPQPAATSVSSASVQSTVRPAPRQDRPAPRATSGSKRRVLIWSVAILSFVSLDVTAYIIYRSHASAVKVAAADAAATLTVAAPTPPAGPVGNTSPVPQLVATAPTSEISNAGASFATIVHDDVGLLIVVGHYEGSIGGHQIAVDLPLGTGSTFVIARKGILVTNRHVVELGHDPSVPTTLRAFGLPAVTLRSTSYQVCFGGAGQPRRAATLLHQSSNFDMALLQTDLMFSLPLTLAKTPVQLNDDVRAVGYPALVQEMFDAQFNTSQHIKDVVHDLADSGRSDMVDGLFSPEAYSPTVTRGIISAPERHRDDGQYTQFDAKVSPGNSGGPLINNRNEVIAIVTLAGRSEAGADGYNFGLLLDQLNDEISPYLDNKP